MSILALDAAGSRAGIALLDEAGGVTRRWFTPTRPGLIETLPPLLARSAADASGLNLVAVTIGPGSFTGLRTAIALAQGFAAARNLPLCGVPVAEAYAAAFAENLSRPLWVVLRARKGRLYLLREGNALACADAELPRALAPVALAGDAANEAAARLAAAGTDVLLTNARALDPVWVGLAALARRRHKLDFPPAQPLYVDPPEARLPQNARAAPL